MSQTIGPAPASNPLTEAEKVDARRFAGYPNYGTGTTTDPFYRYTTEYIQLEDHMANLTDAEVTVCRSKLADLRTLDAAIVSAGQNLDTDRAAVWFHNKQEVRDRRALYNDRRRDLCGFLGVPPGPALCAASGYRRVI